ncbi:5'-3' exoribonuclease 1 isoform X2 [Coccinella septempunctata]|uniref:5'-3' exoribonuclease 1 isoform X2 n=1 Tax=Coccinella septempunctata TaxID=41139 RepID=UPI001D085D00|nr:5'-3' exoribonuclease 1 isoform X2 [Coccinella septempunctata]
MGVPKFFRYISERYPCLSEFVKEHQIPEFDNLYLDMNGIIHNCSHPDDGNAHFRITEEKIFEDIFHYIEALFRMIKPLKVFFMAIDGVAPRAKMNQQRGRRFRSAKDAQKLEDEAIKRGEVLPPEPSFDSNCITPGTEFMARLHEQLKYFVVKKISEDPLWQRCKVIYSGHETPGEGEHKIMDYIRYMRSQPGYDPNTRHCLYGLDADLIMLGLCTHDPHFSLLREEVKFGKKATKKTATPEEVRFALLHLSLMREYLELEFDPLKRTLKTFKFDIEKIIDDWVLMGFLVGNDFIPNLPNLHITDGALPILYKAYMEILPELDGYINEAGILNLERFEIFMKKLGEIDVQNFEEVKEDLFYFRQKTGRKLQPFAKNNTKLKHMEFWKPEGNEEDINPDLLEPLEGGNTPRDSGLSDLIARTEEEYVDEEDEEEDIISSDENDELEFEDYKRSYYMNKLEYEKVTPEVMKSQAEGYVRAIQWNLHYYYNGVCSWSWYYPHHYAPYISDIKNFKNLNLEYDLGKPFLPYEQLLAVLPAASKRLLPSCFQNLMTSETSPIIRYYPEKFETDLNGKKQEWEAVVLVPFIDENILLEAMRSCSDQLTSTEAARNRHSPMLCYTYTQENLGQYDSPMYFPDISNNHAKVQPITIDEIKVPREKLVKGAYPGVLMDVYYPGFPTFKHLEHQGQLEKARVNVFGQASRGENMIIRIIPSERVLDGELPVNLLNKTVYVGYPHLTEAKVVSISNSKQKLTYAGVDREPIEEASPSMFKREVSCVTESYKGRFGIEFGKVLVLVHVRKIVGQKYIFTSNGRISLEKIFCTNETFYPLQLLVENINVYSVPHDHSITFEKLFAVGSICFTLTNNEFYGCKAIVETSNNTPQGQVCVAVTLSKEPDLTPASNLAKNTECSYRSLYFASCQSCIPKNIFSRITGGFYASARTREGGLKTVNLGLDLKVQKKNLETPGYTKRIDGMWYYTDAAIDVVQDYADAFPEIFEYMEKNGFQKNETTSAEDIFPEDSDEKVKAVLTWLRTQPFYNQKKIPCNSPVLEKVVVEEVERIVDTFSSPTQQKTLLNCKPELLYKEELSYGNLLPDPSVTVELFDRIICVKNNHVVPLGMKGTVIGICRPSSDSTEFMYDILFDSEFEGGLEINCSKGRGYRLPLNAFIDISHGARLFKSHMKKPGPRGAPNKTTKNENYKLKNKNTGDENSQNSAFAKFSTSPQTSKDYHAVPPFMPNGEAIYKPHGSYNKQNNNSLQQSKSTYGFGHEERAYSGAPNKFNKQKGQENWRTESSEQTEPNYKIYKKESNQTVVLPNLKSPHPNKNVPSDKKFEMQMRPDFMPAFKKTTTEDPIEETTDALKKLLRIGSDNDNQKSIAENISPSKPNLTHSEQKASSLPNPTLLPSVQLLSYYQSKGLGLPRYQYFSSNSGIQAVIKLPNRQNIIGPYSDSKIGASELVAEKALKVLCSNNDQTSNSEAVPQSFPTPPKQWWSPEKVNDKSAHKKFKIPPKTSTANKNWKDFIPLQVVKKEKANSSCNSNQTMKISRGDIGSNFSTQNQKPENSSDEVIQTNTKKEQKPRKQRKMRIAANFGTQS